MLFIIGGLSIGIGYLIEKKFSYITKLRKTKAGKYFLGSKKAILFTEMIILMIMAYFISVLKVSIDQFDIISGLIVGQLILVLLIASANNFE